MNYTFVTIMILLLAATSLILTFLYIYLKNKETKLEIKSESKINRRKFFRLKFYNLNCNLKYKEKIETKAFVVDLSAGGAKIKTTLDIPMDEKLLLHFKIKKEDYMLFVNIVNKTLDKNPNIFYYGVEFVENKKEQERLLKHLFKIEISRRK